MRYQDGFHGLTFADEKQRDVGKHLEVLKTLIRSQCKASRRFEWAANGLPRPHGEFVGLAQTIPQDAECKLHPRRAESVACARFTGQTKFALRIS